MRFVSQPMLGTRVFTLHVKSFSFGRHGQLSKFKKDKPRDPKPKPMEESKKKSLSIDRSEEFFASFSSRTYSGKIRF
jgi:hypothetical protein